MEFLSPLILMILSNFIVALFINVLLPSKNHLLSVITITLTPLILLSCQFMGFLQINSPSAQKTIVGTGSVMLFIFLLSEGSLPRKFFIFATSMVLMMIPELLVTIPLAFFNPELTGYIAGAPGQINVGAIFYLTYLPLQFILSAVCAILLRKKKDIFSEKNFAVVALFPATLVILLMIYSDFSSFSLTAATVYTSIIIGSGSFLSSIALYLVLISLTRKTALEQQTAFYHKQLDLQLEHYTQFAEYDRTLAQIRHDLRNEMMALQTLLDAGSYHAAQEFTEEMAGTLEQLKMISCSESNMINALIFLKHQKMQQVGISFSCDIDLQDYTPAEERDLCKLLELILADASKNCTSKDNASFIELRCHYIQKQLEIYCCASCNSACDEKLPEDLIHAVDKFSGELELSCTEQSVRVMRITSKN